MEWAILFTVTTLAITRNYIVISEWLKKSEPRGPFRRPTRRVADQVQAAREVLGRLPGEVSMNDLTPEQRERFIQNLQRNSGRMPTKKRRWVEEKVNWKAEGF